MKPNCPNRSFAAAVHCLICLMFNAANRKHIIFQMPPKIKITYIISGVDQAPFIETILDMIDRAKYDVSVLLLNTSDSQLERFLLQKGIFCMRVIYRGKRDYFKAVYKCYRFFKKNKPSIIHVHLNDAGIVGLFAGWLAGVGNRVYTRHGGSQRGFTKRGVMYDRFTNRFATHIIATCQTVKEILINEENVQPDKISVINYGFNMQGFLTPDEKVVEELKEKYNPDKRYPVIGVISRWVEYKGI
jgi:glycosyltransferase involved in cell wall biosynthesis